ncbi:MAG: KR domain-containing protein, partial [Verrucomicrobia bacterium]|nr:KR domain-containing protein [Verrucomicrobiota bacterium]
SKPKASAGESIANLRTLGAKIDVLESKLDCPTTLGTAVDRLLIQKERLGGILHAAGALVVKPLHELSPEDWNEALAGKATGAWTLHELSLDLEPDFFVLFSSTASIWSGTGLGAYSAGNRFLDGLAHLRKAAGKPALVVNWAGWNTGGMHTEDSLRGLRQSGIEPTPVCKGSEWVMQLIESDHSQVMIGDINWNRFLSIIESSGENPLFHELRSSSSQSRQTGGSGSPNSTKPSSHERTPTGITHYLREEFANSLGTATEEIAPEDDLIGTGITSLMVMEVFNHVRQDFDLILYPREFYERPSISQLAPYLLEQLGQETTTPSVRLPALPPLQKPTRVGEPKDITPQKAPSIVTNSQKLSPALFILSAPRSGSTLLRAMLAGHPQLFAPPELYLLPYETLEQRRQGLGDASLNQGLERCFMELMGIDAQAAKAVIGGLTKGNLTTSQTYEMIQNLIPNRLLIDKSPGYSSNPSVLARAEKIFGTAKYIHLIRHPLSVVESVVRMRMHALMDHSDLSPQAIADSNWHSSNANVASFFETLPKDRRLQVKYEELAKSPQQVMEQVSDFLGISFQDELLTPYEGKRMTDGLYKASIPAGDPNFLSHKSIDPKLADVWKTIKLSEPLSQETINLAETFGYEIPNSRPTTSAPKKASKPTQTEPGSKNDSTARLSFAQQRLWFLDQLEGSNAVYNATRTLRLVGNVNREALHSTFKAIMERHSVLRTGFTTNTLGHPVQRVMPFKTLPFTEITLDTNDPKRAWKEAANLIETEATDPFDLEEGPLWRITWIQTQSTHFEVDDQIWIMGETSSPEASSKEESLLVLTFHHSAYDGVSLERLFQEIEALYREAIQAPMQRSLRDLSCQYIDFSKWQRDWHENGGLQDQLGYWKNKLEDHVGKLEFPTDHPRPATQSYRGGSVYFRLDRDLRNKLEIYCKERQLTPYTVTFAAFQILLARYSKQTDIPIGTLINNRRLKEFDALLGMFVNTIVIRGDWSGNPSFNEGIQRFSVVLEEAIANQDAPFELLVEELHPERSLSHQPIFQIMFAMHNARVTFPDLPDVQIQALEADRTHSKFDLNLILTPIDDHYDAVIEFNRDLFEKDSISQLVAGYKSFLSAAIDTPESRIFDLPIMDSETRRNLDSFNQPAQQPMISNDPNDKTDSFIQLFERSAVEFANRTAVVFDTHQISYGELNAMAERAAARLATDGVDHQTVIALMADRSADFLATMLAIFKLNAIYLPLDPH